MGQIHHRPNESQDVQVSRLGRLLGISSAWSAQLLRADINDVSLSSYLHSSNNGSTRKEETSHILKQKVPWTAKNICRSGKREFHLRGE